MRALLLLFAFNFFLPLYGQDIRLSVQTGHSSTINALAYNRDHTFIASCGADNNVVVWHIETRKQFAGLSGHQGSVTGVVWHPEKNELYSAGMDSSLIIWDITTAKLKEKIKFDFPVGAIDIDSKGKSLVVAGKALVIVDLESKEQQKFKLSSNELFTSASFSPDDKLVVIGGKEERFAYVVDLENKTIIAKFFAKMNDVVFDDREAGAVYYAAENGRLIHYNFLHQKTKTVANKSEWNAFNGVRVTNDYIIGVTDNSDVIIYHRKKWKEICVLKAHLQGVKCLDIDKDGQHLITAGKDKRIILWDLDRLEMIHNFQSSIYRINQIAFTEDGQDIIIGFSNGAIRKTNLQTNRTVSNRARLAPVQIEQGWEFLLTTISSYSSNEAIFKLYLLQQSKNIDGAYNTIHNIKLYWDSNWESNQVIIQQTGHKGKAVKQYEKALRHGDVLSPSTLMDFSLLTAQSGDYSATVNNNQLTVYDKNSHSEKFTKTLDHTDRITSVAINAVYNFVATSSWDGMIKFWDLDNGQLLTTFGAFGGSDFVYLNPDNYYFASKGALDNIGFVTDGQIFSFDQFDLMYNRPDLVFKELPYMDNAMVSNYHLAYKKRLTKLGLTEADLKISSDIPEIKVVNNTGATSYDGKAYFDISIADKLYALKSYHVLVNGVPIYSRSGKIINGKELKFRDTININPGDNLIQFYATNDQGVSSFKKSFKLVSYQKSVSSDMYLISIGCSKYEQSEYNLKYAAKDANDIAKFFKSNKQFNHVHIKNLIDEEVTKGKIIDLKTFISSAKENDVILLFIAGHGVLDANLDYYIAAYNMDFQKPQDNGIPFWYFDNLLDQTKSRKKIMLIDACHSGEIDKSEITTDTTTLVEQDNDLVFRAAGTSVKNINEINSFELSKIVFADVRESNGSTVISSAGGAEYALEGDKWGNGIFTHALLTGLGTGEADLNQDKTILVSELQEYLMFTVNKLSNGKQTPTSRAENIANDFRIH